MSWLSNLVAKVKASMKAPDYDKMLVTAIDNLISDSAMVAQWKAELNARGISFTVVNATLEGDVEARTHIQIGSDPWIEVDVRKTLNVKRDRLEPVIGHEIGHIYDANFVYGVPQFIAIVAKEAAMPWDQRTVEKSAIVRENEIRKQLLETHFQEYKTMAPTRERQNQLSGQYRDFAI
jgi:hypothetical protein